MASEASARAAGAIFYLVVAAAWAFGAYWSWPDGVRDISMASLTLSLLLKAAGAVVMGCLALLAIFEAGRDAFG